MLCLGKNTLILLLNSYVTWDMSLNFQGPQFPHLQSTPLILQ